MIFKIFATLMIVMFGYAIVVQLNDPDSWVWIVLYSVALLTTLAAASGYTQQSLLWLILGVYLAAVMWLSPNFVHTSWEAFASVGMNSEQDEQVRELWGMLLCALWTSVMIIRDMLQHPIFSVEERKVTFE